MKILVLPFYLIGLVFGEGAGVTSLIIVMLIGFVCAFLESFIVLGFVKATGYWTLMASPFIIFVLWDKFYMQGVYPQ